MRRNLGLAGLAAVMVLCSASATWAAEPAVAGVARSQPDRVVTLVTGDRVVVSEDRQPAIEPGPGRGKIRFSIRQTGERLSVVPSDVATLVVSGRLDRRLFDITGLIAAGYDDSQSKSIPLIVTYDGVAGRASTRAGGAQMVRDLPAINGTAVRVPKGKAFLDGLPANAQRFGGGVERIWLDGKRRISLDRSVAQIGTPGAWQAGYTGKDVTVAVLDSGIDKTHPDLADRVTGERNFSLSPDGDAAGHGTHVASTIAGTAAASAGKYKGVAPDAQLLDGKVCEDVGFCLDSAILAGMQWAAVEMRADVVNLSLGGPDTPELDPLEDAVNTLTAQTGTLFVIAAGNDGPDEATVGSPGSADAALTVGAVDRQDQIAPFSSRGPRVGDSALKPDVTAPGVDIVAAKAKDAWVGEPVGEHYLRLSGTSMAAPHVAGAAALLAQRHPDWTAAELKAALMASAKPHPEQRVLDQGAGRIDVAKAITQAVVAQPASVSFGIANWPHHDDEPVSRALTYRNLGDSPVTLGLGVSLTGPDGHPAPDAAVTLSASSVSIPAGGSASVTVTSNTDHEGVNGVYSGRVVATAGSQSVVSPIVVDKEVEHYDLTVVHLDRDGKTTPVSGSILTNFEEPIEPIFASDEDGVVTLRLPKGRYALDGFVLQDDVSHLLIQPALTLDRDTTIAVDARLTKPVRITVPRADAVNIGFQIGMDIDTGNGWLRLASGGAQGTTFTAPLGDPAAEATAFVNTGWGVPDAEGSFHNTPVTYSQFDSKQGRFFHGFTRAVQHRELAKVVATQAAQVDGRRAARFASTIAPGMFRPVGYQLFTHDLPSTSTHYLDAGTNWVTSLSEFIEVEPGVREFMTTLWNEATYRPGRTYAERWNTAVFGPGFGDFPSVRFGDVIHVDVPMYSDQNGHAGFSRIDTASTKLFRNGVLIGESESDAFLRVERVGPEAADFKLVCTATRPSVSNFSTTTDAVWTFKSATASEDGEMLPLWAVRYFPAVDGRNVVKRSKVTMLPVKLETQPGAKPGTVTNVEVRVSGDDGTTWTKAAVRRTGDNRYVAVFATPVGGYVSLKANAADSNGNTTEQTIIRAYGQR